MSSTNELTLVSKLTKTEILNGFENDHSFVKMNYGAAKCIEELAKFIDKNLPQCTTKLELSIYDRSIEEVSVITNNRKQCQIVDGLIYFLLESKAFNSVIENHILKDYNYPLFETELSRTIKYNYKKIESFIEVEDLKAELKTNSSGIIKRCKL